LQFRLPTGDGTVLTGRKREGNAMLRYPLVKIALALLCSGSVHAADDIHLFVKPEGSDTAGGLDPASALATPAKALALVAEARASGEAGTITVELLPGDYVLTDTLRVTAGHAGSKGRPTRIVGVTGHKAARLLGGSRLTGFARLPADSPMRKRLPLSVVDKVRQVDLQAAGLGKAAGLGQAGFGIQRKAGHAQLYINGKPMPLAGYPNEGYLKVAEAVAKRRFAVGDRRPAAWAEPEKAWAYGYWFYDWADSYRPINGYDAKTGVIALGGDQAPRYGIRKGQRHRFLNVPEELDSPGEWIIDHKIGVLYLLPPGDLAKADVILSQLGRPLVEIRDASHIQLGRLILEAGRSEGVRISGGSGNVVVGCILRGFGGTAITVAGGRGHGVKACSLYNLAEGAVTLSGGDRKTLSPSGHVVDGCDIHDFGLWCKTYRPAVALRGVGGAIRRTHIHQAPHVGVLLSGNDHVVELNEIDHVALETGDVGAIYLGRDWTYRGNVVRHNSFHDIGGVGMGAMGVYNDDCAGGTTIYGNLFEKVRLAIMVGGGRDIVAENNLFIHCDRSVALDDRGLRWKQPREPAKYPSWDLVGKLKKLPYDRPPWSAKYPELATILDDDPWAPVGNRFVRNIVIGGRAIYATPRARQLLEQKGNLIIKDATDAMIERIKAEPGARLKGFQPLPLGKMGFAEDAARRLQPGWDRAEKNRSQGK
jgi:hypothetical protein